jgi:hypothetical protein
MCGIKVYGYNTASYSNVTGKGIAIEVDKDGIPYTTNTAS